MRRVVALFTLLVACNSNQPEKPAEPQRSPNASVLPTPLAEKSEQLPRPTPMTSGLPSPAGSAGRKALVEINPTPMSAQRPPEPDDELIRIKDAAGLVLHALWRWPNFDSTAPEPEHDPKAIDEANARLLPKIEIELQPTGRMSWRWLGTVFPLPQGSELRARVSSYGHVLVWPQEKKYRVLAPGALRTTLGEHRADTTPLVLGTLRQLPGGRRLGRPTENSEISTPHGTLILEQVALEEAGIAGSLLCRTLVELVAASPASPICAEDRLPLYAALSLADGGKCAFEVTEMTYRPDVTARIAISPPLAAFQTSGLPESAPILVDPITQSKLHSRARGDAQNAQGGLAVVNSNSSFAYLILDRVRVSMLEPFGFTRLTDLRPGRYRATWHSFFGTVLRGPELVEVPGRLDSRVDTSADAGAPK